jgi:hypothetical protein
MDWQSLEGDGYGLIERRKSVASVFRASIPASKPWRQPPGHGPRPWRPRVGLDGEGGVRGRWKPQSNYVFKPNNNQTESN